MENNKSTNYDKFRKMTKMSNTSPYDVGDELMDQNSGRLLTNIDIIEHHL